MAGAALALASASGAVLAQEGAKFDCAVSAAPSDFKAKIEGQGYNIKTFKVSKGKCYEIYGTDKGGKKVEIYFNPETADVLESK